MLAPELLAAEDFRFDPETHTYWLGLIWLPSATGVLRAAGLQDDFSQIPPLVLEHARQVGEAAHKACQYLIEGTLDHSTLTAEVALRLNGFERFLEDYKPFVRACEKPIYHRELLYGVTPDLDLELEGDPTALEIKTSLRLSAYLRFQLKLQELCMGKRKRRGLQLKKDGTYYLTKPYDNDEEDEAVVRGAVAIAHWKMKNKMKNTKC